MENWIYAAWPIMWKMSLSCLIIFVIMIGVTRTFGLRTFAKMSSFDFASTIAIGSILASVVMNGGQSFAKGGLAIALIVMLQNIFSYLSRKSGFFSLIAQNTPVILMRDGVIFQEALSRVNMSEQSLLAKLREANVLRMEDVQAVVFETTGDVSVLHGSDKQLEAKLLEGVSTPSA